MGQVCYKHGTGQYYETECPYCEEPEVSPLIIGAEEFNAHIAEAAAAGKAARESENIAKNNALLERLKATLHVYDVLPRWPKDKAT